MDRRDGEPWWSMRPGIACACRMRLEALGRDYAGEDAGHTRQHAAEQVEQPQPIGAFADQEAASNV
jgi:hypothetical protein